MFTILLASVLTYLLHQSLGQWLDRPRDTAILLNRQGVVECNAQAESDVLQWSHFIDQHETVIWNSRNMLSNDENLDVIANEVSGRYDLVMERGNASYAGTYRVALLYSGVSYNVEIVLLGGLGCHPDENGFQTIEGAEIVVTAFTSVYGNIEPTLRWFRQGEALTPYVSYSEDNVIKSVMSNMSATPENDGVSFYGELLFEEEEGGDGSLAPSYNDSCTTFYTVEYRVRDVTIYPQATEDEPLYVAHGGELNCSAKGNPVPSYYWYCNEGSIKPGAIFTVPATAPDKVTCVCEASNRVGGVPLEAFGNVTFVTTNAGVSNKHNQCLTMFLLTSLCVLWLSFSY